MQNSVIEYYPSLADENPSVAHVYEEIKDEKRDTDATTDMNTV